MRVLLVEDNPADAHLVQSLLREAGGVEVRTVPTLAAGLERLAGGDVDVVLLDLNLPDARGLATLSRLLDVRDDVAVVVLSGHDDEQLAYRALQAGAQDYLVKGTQDPTLLRRVLRYATERKRLETQLRLLNVELEARVERRTRELAQANRELESFAYSVSHDLQAPLRTIGGFAEILATDYGERLDDEAREYLNRMRDAGRHMGELLDALLELSRVSRFVLKPVPVDLADLARAVFADIARASPERRTTLEIQGSLGVQGDPRMLEIALRNLLNNAFKFTRGRQPGQIRLTASLQSGERCFEIADDGVGFDPRFAHRLFEPFQRLHRADEFEGTGIGLATVQRIVQRHGGRIWADGMPGRGASFRFTLPDVLPTPLPELPSGAGRLT
ncbi:response regulator [Myxococcota bacterium]|nr:response regulator [Myxococcota bacterium]